MPQRHLAANDMGSSGQKLPGASGSSLVEFLSIPRPERSITSVVEALAVNNIVFQSTNRRGICQKTDERQQETVADSELVHEADSGHMMTSTHRLLRT